MRGDGPDVEWGEIGVWRERLRPRNVAFAVVGLLVLFVAWQVVLGLRSKPGAVRDARGELRALILEVQGVEGVGVGGVVSMEEAAAVDGNGWDYLLASVEVYRRVSAEVEAVLLAEDPARGAWQWVHGYEYNWPFDGRALGPVTEIEPALVEATRDALHRFTAYGGDALIDRMLASPVVLRPVPDDLLSESLVGLLFKELGDSRRLVFLVVGAMHQSALRGESESAAAWCRRALGIGGAYTRQGTLIEMSVGLSLINHAIERVRELAISGAIDEPTAMALLEVFNEFAAMDGGRRSNGIGSILGPIRGERLMILEIIDLVHTDSGRLIITDLSNILDALGENPTIAERIERMPVVNAASVFFPNKSQTLALAEEYYASLMGPFESREGDALYSGFSGIRFASNLPRTQLVLRHMLPAMDRMIGHWSRARRELQLTRVALASAVYRHREGAWPSDASDLVGTALDEAVREPVREWEDPADGALINLREVLGGAGR